MFSSSAMLGSLGAPKLIDLACGEVIEVPLVGEAMGDLAGL